MVPETFCPMKKHHERTRGRGGQSTVTREVAALESSRALGRPLPSSLPESQAPRWLNSTTTLPAAFAREVANVQAKQSQLRPARVWTVQNHIRGHKVSEGESQASPQTPEACPSLPTPVTRKDQLSAFQPTLAQRTCPKMYLDVTKQKSVTRGGESREDRVPLHVHLWLEHGRSRRCEAGDRSRFLLLCEPPVPLLKTGKRPQTACTMDQTGGDKVKVLNTHHTAGPAMPSEQPVQLPTSRPIKPSDQEVFLYILVGAENATGRVWRKWKAGRYQVPGSAVRSL